MQNPSIDPGTSRALSGHSTTVTPERHRSMNRIGSEFWVALRDTLQEFRRRQHALCMYARRSQMCCQKNDEPLLELTKTMEL